MAYELNGRVAQKRRTREALIAAARELVAEGVTPTVEAAAEAASISRTTAYRYFPNQRALLAAAHPETAADSLLPDDAPSDVAARLDLVVAAFTRLIVDTEAQQRTMLRLSLEAGPAERSELPLRQGRAIKWIEEALAPLQSELSATELHRLAIAIRSATGIEALAWLTDVAGLSRDDATDLMRWSARAMLDATRAEQAATDA
jgi:AcrR family transcriptional regulator